MVPWKKGYSKPYGNLYYACKFINNYSPLLQVPVRWRPGIDLLCVSMEMKRDDYSLAQSPRCPHVFIPMPGGVLSGVLNIRREAFHWIILRFADNQPLRADSEE
jgi:hypothetical protein